AQPYQIIWISTSSVTRLQRARVGRARSPALRRGTRPPPAWIPTSNNMSGQTYLEQHGLYGLMAEFEHPEELVKAAGLAFSAGYRKMEGYSPLPIEGLSEALGYKRHFVSLMVLTGGIT